MKSWMKIESKTLMFKAKISDLESLTITVTSCYRQQTMLHHTLSSRQKIPLKYTKTPSIFKLSSLTSHLFQFLPEISLLLKSDIYFSQDLIKNQLHDFSPHNVRSLTFRKKICAHCSEGKRISL